MREKLPPFMDDTKVVKAIQSNDPAKVTTLANEYITTFSNSFNVAFKWFKKGVMSQHLIDCWTTTSFFHLDSDKIRGNEAKYLLVFQLALWSCVSNKCFQYITVALVNSRRESVQVNEALSWSWMENLVKCVTITSQSVYQVYASDEQKQYPCCMVLLLPKSLLKITSTFVNLAMDPNYLAMDPNDTAMDANAMTVVNETSGLTIVVNANFLKDMTSSFHRYCQNNVKENGHTIKDEKTLGFFMECDDHTFSTNQFLSSLFLEGKNDNHDQDSTIIVEGGKNIVLPKNVTEEEKEEKEEKEMNEKEKPPKDNIIEEDAVRETNGDIVEFKKHALLSRLQQALDKKYSILKQLQKERVSRDDYLDRCMTFTKDICPKDLGETDLDYFHKAISFFGLIIHEVLKCTSKNPNMKKVHMAIFGPILNSCINATSQKDVSKYLFWKEFLNKLVPKCATLSNIRDSASKLRHFQSSCLHLIGVKSIEEVFFYSGSPNACLAFYYEQKYLSDDSRGLVLEMKSDYEKWNNTKNNAIQQKKRNNGDSTKKIHEREQSAIGCNSPALNLRKRSPTTSTPPFNRKRISGKKNDTNH